MSNETELKRSDLDVISNAIYGESRSCKVDLLRSFTTIADSNALYLIDGAYVLYVSPQAFPQSVQLEASAIKAMREGLKDRGHVLPMLSAEGTLDGRSFMVVPRMQPLSSKRLGKRIDSFRIRGAVLAWLRDLANLAAPHSDDSLSRFSSRLTALAEMPGLSGEIASAAHAGLAGLESGAITVNNIPMHGDLWFGNLLRKADGSLCVIDWGGSELRGYGVYDLMRLGESLRIPPRIMRRELARHETILGGPQAAQIHLLAALGHYAANLGQFPRERFVAMAGGVWRLFSSLH